MTRFTCKMSEKFNDAIKGEQNNMYSSLPLNWRDGTRINKYNSILTRKLSSIAPLNLESGMNNEDIKRKVDHYLSH